MKDLVYKVEKRMTVKALKKFLVAKLTSLYSDVNTSSDKATDFLADIKKTKEEKRKLLMSLYAAECAPAKVTDFSGMPKRECDMTAEMIDFCAGFDKYIASMRAEYKELIRKKRDAVALLTLLVSLRNPYSKILYLKYYTNVPLQTICKDMHFSRSTFFRKRDKALSDLAVLFAERNDIKLIQDK